MKVRGEKGQGRGVEIEKERGVERSRKRKKEGCK